MARIIQRRSPTPAAPERDTAGLSAGDPVSVLRSRRRPFLFAAPARPPSSMKATAERLTIDDCAPAMYRLHWLGCCPVRMLSTAFSHSDSLPTDSMERPVMQTLQPFPL